MTRTVLKAFATRQRRLAEGDTVSPDENFEPHTLQSLEAGGFIDKPTTEKAPSPRRSRSAK